MPTDIGTLAGNYEIDRTHSSVQFAVKHIVTTFRASFADVEGRLVAANGSTALTASARAESLSITDPPEFREHVVRGGDFFNADEHPTVTFRSTDMELQTTAPPP